MGCCQRGSGCFRGACTRGVFKRSWDKGYVGNSHFLSTDARCGRSLMDAIGPKKWADAVLVVGQRHLLVLAIWTCTRGAALARSDHSDRWANHVDWLGLGIYCVGDRSESFIGRTKLTSPCCACLRQIFPRRLNTAPIF